MSVENIVMLPDGRKLAYFARLPNATVELVPDGGHISVLDSSAEAIFAQLKDRAIPCGLAGR